MIYCPLYSIGSKVSFDDTGAVGEIVGIDAALKANDTGKFTYKTHYMVLLEDGSKKKVIEANIKELPTIKPENVQQMDAFIADSLLLTRHHIEDVEIRNKIDLSLKGLLSKEINGGQ